MLTGWCGGGSGACCAALRSALLVDPVSGPRRTVASPDSTNAWPIAGAWAWAAWLGAAEGLAASTSLIFSCRGCRDAVGVLELLIIGTMAP